MLITPFKKNNVGSWGTYQCPHRTAEPFFRPVCLSVCLLLNIRALRPSFHAHVVSFLFSGRVRGRVFPLPGRSPLVFNSSIVCASNLPR